MPSYGFIWDFIWDFLKGPKNVPHCLPLVEQTLGLGMLGVPQMQREQNRQLSMAFDQNVIPPFRKLWQRTHAQKPHSSQVVMPHWTPGDLGTGDGRTQKTLSSANIEQYRTNTLFTFAMLCMLHLVLQWNAVAANRTKTSYIYIYMNNHLYSN